MRFLRNRTLVGSIGVVGVLAGSLAVGGWQAATAATPPPGPGPTTVNQGTGGTSAWKVTGTVNVGNFPAFPTTQQVSGSVGITNQTLYVAGTTAAPFVETGHYLNPGDTDDTGPIDTTLYRELRIYVSCVSNDPTDCTNTEVDVTTQPGSATFSVDQFTLISGETVTRTEMIPGTNVDVQAHNGSPNGVGISWAVLGRTD